MFCCCCCCCVCVCEWVWHDSVSVWHVMCVSVSVWHVRCVCLWAHGACSGKGLYSRKTSVVWDHFSSFLSLQELWFTGTILWPCCSQCTTGVFFYEQNPSHPHPPLAGVGIAQLVECPDQNPSVILMWVWVPSAAKDYFQEAASNADSLMVSVQAWYAVARINNKTVPNTGSHTTVWTHENTAHTNRNG